MFTLNCKGRLMVIERPIVMGIINATPDSFYAGSRPASEKEVLLRAENMMQHGATILDIGGQSTRPGSEQVGEEEELKRVLPSIESIAKRFPEAFISIDSFYSKVVRESILAGAHIVNDVSAGAIDEALLPTVAALKVPYVLMHMKGHPQTMQLNPSYENVVTEVFDALNFKMYELVKSGIKDIIIDPGFGFGKNATHNFKLLKELNYFSQLNKLLLVGVSRKATVYKTLGVVAEEALNGTTVMHTLALLNGANILRVHDVKEAMEAIKLVEKYSEA
ncbi:MAG TPA: dihydropteroate synthase [Flavisolibacter sp.]|nr:dihydropteroate synthase [Flavisolibacter sp.]